jgi:hypothetical protein
MMWAAFDTEVANNFLCFIYEPHFSNSEILHSWVTCIPLPYVWAKDMGLALIKIVLSNNIYFSLFSYCTFVMYNHWKYNTRM